MYHNVVPSRRKSCEACKAAKRRCDLVFPFCSRCVQRGEPCVYPGKQPVFPDYDSELPPLPDLSKEPWPVLALTSPLTAMHEPCLPLPAVADYCSPESQQGYASYASLIQPSVPQETVLPPTLELALPRTRPLRFLSEVVASHLQFTIDVCKDAPSRMVLENQAPWCHAQLYRHQMPKVMQGKSF